MKSRGLLYITLSLTLSWGRDNDNCYFSPFSPWSLPRQRSSTNVSVVLAGSMSLALAFFFRRKYTLQKNNWNIYGFNDLWSWCYFNNLLKQQWKTAWNWVTGGVFHNCDSHSKAFFAIIPAFFIKAAYPKKATLDIEWKWIKTEWVSTSINMSNRRQEDVMSLKKMKVT